jgi:hypothetical protein
MQPPLLSEHCRNMVTAAMTNGKGFFVAQRLGMGYIDKA